MHVYGSPWDYAREDFESVKFSPTGWWVMLLRPPVIALTSRAFQDYIRLPNYRGMFLDLSHLTNRVERLHMPTSRDVWLTNQGFESSNTVVRFQALFCHRLYFRTCVSEFGGFFRA